jgi:4-amino-4-deoxy-L-arabinose transferase-like glycosyltransferase
MIAVKKFLSSLKEWVVNNKKEAAILGAILLFGAILRLYRIDEYMIFLADQGRDALVVRRLLVNFDPILVGPGTSVGNMYLGPIYYYMMAPALWLANYSPVGPSVMVALFGIATIFFLWYFARRMFGVWGAGIAALLYAVSPTVVSLSIFSWNPNIMPFFALATIYSIWKFWQEERFGWLVVAGASMGFVLQSHYLGLLLLPTLGVFWLLTYLKVRKAERRQQFIIYSLYGLGAFALLMSPLVIFDARHGWRNFLAMKEYFLVSSGTSFGFAASLNRVRTVTQEISAYLLGGRNLLYGKISLGAVLLFLGWIGLQWKKMQDIEKKGFMPIFVWLGMGILGLAFYRSTLYDHYYGFLFPAPFLLLAGFFSVAARKSKSWGKILVIVFASALILVSWTGSHLRNEPNKQMQRTIKVSDKIIQEAKGERFNLAAIADRNYEAAYQYFLEKERAPLVIIDPQRVEETVTRQLFVVCEKPEPQCDPTHSPKAEIANYGWSKIDAQWEVEGVILYKLVHSL